MATEGLSSEYGRRVAAFEAAIEVVANLAVEMEAADFLHLHIIVAGSTYRHEITKQFPKHRLKAAGPPHGGQERRARG